MRPIFFVSDIHLCASRPEITKAFIHFLDNIAPKADALYILGDLFEYWAGDDELDNPHHQTIINALHGLSQHGTRVYFMHGNRDFLIGQDFAMAAGLSLLPDPYLLGYHGKHILLSHADALCTDDVAYQIFRTQVRDETWQQAFLSQPLATRKATIESLRQRSEQEKAYKKEDIMDVNADAVERLLVTYDYPEFFIHGHTHRPKMHTIRLGSHICQRWVLGDWYAQGSYLVLDAHGCRAELLRL